MVSVPTRNIESPCNKICTLAADDGPCLGCGRSLDEIINWLRYSHEQRAMIMALLPERLATMRAERKARKKGRA